MAHASILAEALQLLHEERAKLITELIDSVENEPPEDPVLVEQAWATELQARIASADANPDDAIDWTDVRPKLTAK